MTRAVLDTNVLASGVTHPKGHSGQLLMAWRRRAFTIVVSEHILEELAETLEDRYFRKRLTSRERQAIISRLRRQAQRTEISAKVTGVAPSPNDDLVLATAESGGAEYVVTGDAKFLAVKEFRGIEILSPSAFLTLLKSRAG